MPPGRDSGDSPVFGHRENSLAVSARLPRNLCTERTPTCAAPANALGLTQESQIGGSDMCHCCGHRWHQWGPGQRYGYRRGREYGYGQGFGPGFARGPRRRRDRIDELEDYLGDLEEEITEVKAELDDLRGPAQTEK